MEPSAVIIAVAIALLIAIIVTHIRAEKKLRAQIEAQFGQAVPPPEFDEDVSGLWQQRLQYDAPAHYIDDTTWNDLEMDKLFDQINACQTSVGEECLYAMLREPLFDRDSLLDREALMKTLSVNAELRLKMQMILAKTGKVNGNGLSTFCYDVSSSKIAHAWLYNLLAALPLLCAAVLFLNAGLGAALTAAAVMANGVVHYRIKRRLDAQMASVRYFAVILWCAKKIAKMPAIGSHVAGQHIRDSHNVFKRLGGKLSAMLRERVSELDSVAEYVKIIILYDVRNYNRIIAMMEKNAQALRQLYCGIGELDAAIAILSYRHSLPFFSVPEFTHQGQITAKDAYHPFLVNPVPNSTVLRKGSLISGSNASGKSTFIKAIAICGILAQTIHTCTARAYKTRFALVMTSMAVRDDITASESYFITEIKSLRRILQKIPEVFCACYIDEILKGTNTIERIAASAAVLRHLSKADCLCMVATHDIELTWLLDNGYDNLHFCEQMSDQGISFDYTIRQGPSRTRNAIRLLDFLGFDAKITEDADRLVEHFERTQKWQD